MDFKRMHAQRQAELDEALLRELHGEQAKASNRLKLLLNEIEGAHKIILEYQQHIQSLGPQIAELQTVLDTLQEQEQDIRREQAHRQQRLSGFDPGKTVSITTALAPKGERLSGAAS